MTAKKILLPASLVVAIVLVITAWNQTVQNKLDKTVYECSSVIKTIYNYNFRDLNKNGKLDVYEDVHQPINARVNNLLSQMNIEEKAGMMFINCSAKSPGFAELC